MTTILVTGALGQIGSELVALLSRKYGKSSVIVSDVKEPMEREDGLEYVRLDVTDSYSIGEVIREKGITAVFHLAAILSASGEKNPRLAYRVNSDGTFNVLDQSLENGIEKVMIPSTIGVFGPETPKDMVPDITITRPTTMYGITKVNAELLSLYYRDKMGLDVRGVRFPGIISYLTPPSAGTTDYAVDMFYHAVRHQNYTCYLKEGTPLPMMYMPDALNSLIKLFEAKKDKLRYCLDYNIASYTFTPRQLYESIKKHIGDFSVSYVPDYRQKIAESWPYSLDSSAAIEDWGFSPEYGLEATVKDMITNLRKLFAINI